jgi:hypothetical protein
MMAKADPEVADVAARMLRDCLPSLTQMAGDAGVRARHRNKARALAAEIRARFGLDENDVTQPQGGRAGNVRTET